MSHLLVVRHGPAEELRAGQRDADRALTEGGWNWTRDAFRGLPGLGRGPKSLLVSPFLRAQQTADLLAEAFFGGTPRVETWLDLVPSGAVALLEVNLRARLAEAPNEACVAIISHQPLVSDLVAHLTGRRVAFPPAGWTLLSFEQGVFRLVASSEMRP